MPQEQYYPNEDFKAQANLKAPQAKELSSLYHNNPMGFWAKLAREELYWHQDFISVLDESQAPHYNWFNGAKTNISYNCLETNITAGLANKTAIIFEGEAGDSKKYSYQELLDEVNKCANTLERLGIKSGDRVCIYMPLCPEAIIAMQACMRIGAVHSVVFAGFSAQALQDRLVDAEAKLLITADAIFRRGNIINLLAIVEEATKNLDLELLYFSRIEDTCSRANIPESYKLKDNIEIIKQCIIRLKDSHRLHLWSEQLSKSDTAYTAKALDANATSFILYTSGSTGKPKGIEHRVAGYILWAKLSTKWVFDIKPNDIYWCTADIGWITGHSYVAYGPLAAGATQLIYEGSPNYPDKDRFWQLIDKYQVSIFYTAPTAIRTFIEWGEEYITKHSLASLRLLGSVGEPINPEVWRWYHRVIGKNRCPIVDTWWQTETGGIMITTLPGLDHMQAGWAGRPLPGISAKVNEDGLLIIDKPWPSMLKGIYKNPERYKQSYWSRVEGAYTAGDAALEDDTGYIQLAGRIDDVINVSGHRLGTAEIESALVASDKVVEAAVVAIPHPIKGEGIIAYVVLGIAAPATRDNNTAKNAPHEAIGLTLKELVAKSIGSFAKPERIIIVPALPKTRSGKIMRRLLKDIAQGKEPSGDLSTLENPSLISELIKLS